MNGDPALADRETTAFVEFLDLYPTLASCFNLEGIPDYLEGKSFESVLRNPEAAFRDHVNILTRRGEMTGRSVKTREWRYTEWDDGKRGTELYDQLNDPMEYNNLSARPEYQEIKDEMKKLIKTAE
jgi:arylsulfatase A-like enzyme